MKFGEVVRTLIKEQGMTQEEVAKKAGFTTQSGLANMLSKRNVTLETMLKILDVFGYTVAVVKKEEVNLSILEIPEEKKKTRSEE